MASSADGGTPGEPNNPAANPTVSGTDGNDVFYVRLDAGGSNVQIYLSNPPSGAPAYSFRVNSTESLTINGLGGDDRMYLDVALNGMPGFAAGMRFDGGTQASSTGDTVDVIGTATQSGKFTPTSAPGATVHIAAGVFSPEDQPLVLGGPVNVTVHGFGSFEYATPAGTSDVDADTVAGQTRLSGTSGGQALANLAFYNIGTMVVDLGSASLNIAPAASIDLGDHDLILRSTAGAKDALLNSINGYIRSGRNRGAWNGNGIISSAAAANAARTTGLAAMINDDGSGNALRGMFNGVAVDANAILIKYTYDGDSDLDGDVDADDYARIDTGFAQRNNPGFVASYRNGDFDYSSSINSDDFFLIDRAFSSQGATLAETVPQAAESALTIQKTATRKHKHRKRPHASDNGPRQEWKSVARY